MQTTHPSIRSGAALAVCLLWLAPFAAADRAGEARARKHRRLGELALGMDLKRDAVATVDGVVTITNDTLAATADGGHLTTVERSAAELPKVDPPDAKELAAERKLREQWQRRVAAQRRRVAAAAAELAALDAKIDALVNQAFDGGAKGAKLWVRVEEMRARRPAAAEELRSEETQLARIIRDARRDGAEPGWFR